ncbi:MAG: DEAD/DEAH box helicase [Chlorobiaceae bacterium]|nr:DEAD/DEAH box helicase [Chlorobiaceae bacterium]
MTFSSLGLIDPLLKALDEEGYSSPTPIQAEAIPLLLDGNDLLGCAQTGTGKTAAFALPILQLLLQEQEHGRKRKIRCLVLTPTRELALQIGESFEAYGRHTGLKSTVIFGGVNQNPQTRTLAGGVDILVATPGRLLDLMGQEHLHLRDIEFFVLDEADRMLDMGFIHDVKRVLSALPKKKQSLFFSATMPPAIVKLAASILHQPKTVTVTPVSSTAEIINQHVLFVDRENKNSLLAHLLQNRDIASVLAFTRTKHGADKVARFLTHKNIKAEAIHGNKSQNARQRALGNFKSGETRVLVATDIAARGIDVDDLEYVINIDLPNVAETYVHRIGRTGRAGNRGTAYSFCNAEEKEYLRDIEKLIDKSITVIDDHPYPMMNFEVEAPQPVPAKKGNTGHQQPKPKQQPAAKRSARSGRPPKKRG